MQSLIIFCTYYSYHSLHKQNICWFVAIVIVWLLEYEAVFQFLVFHFLVSSGSEIFCRSWWKMFSPHTCYKMIFFICRTCKSSQLNWAVTSAISSYLINKWLIQEKQGREGGALNLFDLKPPFTDMHECLSLWAHTQHVHLPVNTWQL